MADDIQPAALADGWTVASPESVDLDGGLIRGIGPHFESWTDANAHAILIARHGKLVYEHYFTGEDWAWGKALGRVAYDPTKRHDLRSISKSVTSLLFGIGVDRGWIDDLETPVFTYFPEHADLRTAEKDAITLRHLLTMTAGFAWNEDLPYADPQNSERLMTDAPDRCRYVLEQPIVRPPGRPDLQRRHQRAARRDPHQGLGAAARRAGAAGAVRSAGDRRRGMDPLRRQHAGRRLRPPHAAARPAGARPARARWRTLAKQAGRVPRLDRGVDGAPHQWRWPVLLRLSMVAGPLARQSEIKWISGMGYGGQRLYVVPSKGLVVLTMAGLYDSTMVHGIVGEVVPRRYALQSAVRGREITDRIEDSSLFIPDS